MADSEFRSFFLPLKENEHAIFSSMCAFISTPLALGPSAADGATTTASAPASPSRVLFSPAEGEEEETEATRSGSKEVPTLFQLWCARMFGMISVLDTREVVLFDLSNKAKGPVEVKRLQPTRTLAEAKEGIKSSRAAAAMCASLIPLEVALRCHVSRQATLPGEQEAAGTRRTRNSFYRGIVGASDGRVSVFTEDGYAFGFPAHECPVLAAYAVTHNQAATEDSAAKKAATAGAALTQTLQESTRHMSFVTCGADGRIFLWRRHASNMKPLLMVDGSTFLRHAAFCVYQPPTLDISWLSADVQDDNAFAQVSPSAASYGSAGGVNRFMTPHALLVHASKWSLHARVLEENTETVTLQVPKSAPSMHSITALATDGDMCLVARKCDLYYLSMGPDVTCTLVLTAKERINHLVMDDCVAVAGCDKKGYIYVLHVRKAPAGLTLLGQYYTYHYRPIRSLSLQAVSMTLVITDSAGSVEVVRLPPTYKRAIENVTTVPRHPLLRQLPAAMSLWSRCAMEEAMAAAGKSSSENKLLRKANDLSTWEEALLLARMSIPLECNAYMHDTTQIR